ncbi:MAG: ribokinase, partial [Actinobacteria bacterium]|nr:ribokinase [Actinomycetota bacterium]NIS32972.1 ribokinase [Actinomycetota bacterium]NIW29697.1 ribokinase [Actinomycetota bacterium]NIX22200.1 ribokinase [Actinomycetota bacterium]
GAGAPEEAARRIAELGPREVIVTLGGDGSVVLARDVLHRIEAHPPSRLVDATGCGDTFLAAYMAHRLGSDDVAA